MTAPVRSAPRPPPVEFTIDLKVTSLNVREHFRVKAKRVAKQREQVAAACAKHLKTKPTLPLLVTLTRVYAAPQGKKLDRWDNLPGSMKPVIDGLCDTIELDDADERFEVKFVQVQGPEYAVHVRLESLGNETYVPKPPRGSRKARAAANTTPKPRRSKRATKNLGQLALTTQGPALEAIQRELGR